GDPFREPGLHADIEEQRRERGNDDRGRDGHHAEEDDQPDVEPRPGAPPSALNPDYRDPPGDYRAEKQQDDQVQIQQKIDRVRIVTERRAFGEHRISRKARQHGGNGQDHRQLIGEPDPGRPDGSLAPDRWRAIDGVAGHTDSNAVSAAPAPGADATRYATILVRGSPGCLIRGSSSAMYSGLGPGDGPP